MNTKVEMLLDRKGHEVATIDVDASAFDAVRMMAACKVGSVVVTEEATIRGIVTERDYLKRVVLPGRPARDTLVGEVMTRHLRFVGPDDTLDDCMAIMTRHRCRHLPVRSGRRLIGILSIGDCVAYLCQELRAENYYLYEYIHGPLCH